MLRNEKLLNGITKEMYGLEIGPSINPVAPKSQGYNVETVDHTDKNGLIEKYKNDPGAKDKIHQIEEVDYVWHGESYHELCKKENAYDYILASHMIEHCVDIIRFLQDCEIMLKTDSYLVLAVPDKRYMFDLYRPVTTVGVLLDVYERNGKFHSYGSVADYYLSAVNAGIVLKARESQKTDTWGNYNMLDESMIEMKHTLPVVNSLLEMAKAQEEYVDIHRYVFTPSSFALLIHDLNALGFIHFEVDSVSEAVGYEFAVRLKKTDDKKKQSVEEDVKERLRLLKQIKEEESQTFFSFKEVNEEPISWNLSMYYSIDEFEKSENSLYIRGWSFVKDVDCDNQKVYVAFTHKKTKERHFYPLISTLRQDVVLQEQSHLYERAGFMGEISINHENYYCDKESIEIFIKHDDSFVSNRALSKYDRLVETDAKKIIRKAVL